MELTFERTLDIGHNMLARNDALRAGGSFWCHSRRCHADLEPIGRPLLAQSVPENFELTKGLVRLLNRVSRPLKPFAMDKYGDWVPRHDWCSCLNRQHELATSLYLKKNSGQLEERVNSGRRRRSTWFHSLVFRRRPSTLCSIYRRTSISRSWSSLFGSSG